MDPKTQIVVENIKFLEKMVKNKHVWIDDLFDMCKENNISGFTLNRIMLELEKAGTVLFTRNGRFVFIDCTEVNVDEKISG